MRSHGLTWGDLIGTLTDHSQRGRSGLGVLRRVVDQHYGQIAGDSHTEDRAFQILVDSGRVPVPERLVPVTCADGVVVTPDFLWSDYKLILEVFGVDHKKSGVTTTPSAQVTGTNRSGTGTRPESTRI